MPKSELRFLHISDLHFRTGPGRSGTVHDADQALRDALVADVKRFVAESGRALDGILVSGDVAYAGLPAEFELAVKWLAELTDAAGCSSEDVWVVPGNHDIDRTVIAKSPTLRAFQSAIREGAREKIDDAFRDWLASPEASLILGPLEAYNDFAAKFGCRVSAERPFWERDFSLNDGSTLRLRGMTSALACDGQESDERLKLAVGSMQWAEMTVDGVTNLVLCHHPPEWLRDAQAFDDALPLLAAVQLFGHMHRQRVRTFDNSVRLFAGALHPDRHEPNWKPQFNYLGLCVDRSDEGRQLRATVETRVWSEDGRCFVIGTVGNAAAPGARTFCVRLPPWTAGVSTGASREEIQSADVPGKTTVSGSDMLDRSEAASMREDVTATKVGDPMRRLVYRYLTLSHRQRVEIAQRLGLVRDEDDGLRDSRLVELYFSRAQEGGRLAALWREVEARHGSSVGAADNPFEATKT